MTDKLISALRQYKHNDDDSGFVFGYDKEQADKVFMQLIDEITELKVQLIDIKSISTGIQLGEELGSFSSEQDWINRARNVYISAYEKIGSKDVVTLDSASPRRIMDCGLHFRIAKEQGTYPAVIYAKRPAD